MYLPSIRRISTFLFTSPLLTNRFFTAITVGATLFPMRQMLTTPEGEVVANYWDDQDGGVLSGKSFSI